MRIYKIMCVFTYWNRLPRRRGYSTAHLLLVNEYAAFPKAAAGGAGKRLT
jgi:hypothetical protein